MKIKSLSAPTTGRLHSFTLIELLVVIAIIGILAGLLLAAVHKARQSAKKARAAVQINNMAIALKGYYNEYGIWPHTAGTVPTANLTAAQLQRLYQICIGADVDLGGTAGGNTRQITFMEFKASETAVLGGSTNIVDPWGGAYQVRLDDNADNKVPTYGAGSTNINGGFVIWSKGSDGTQGNADDVVGWK